MKLQNFTILIMLGAGLHLTSCTAKLAKQQSNQVENAALTQEEIKEKRALLNEELKSITDRHPGSQVIAKLEPTSDGSDRFQFEATNIKSKKDNARVIEIGGELDILRKQETKLKNTLAQQTKPPLEFRVLDNSVPGQNIVLPYSELDQYDEKPEPVGGMSELYKFILANLKYPESAREAGLQGRVFLQFVIERDGAINEVEVVKGVSEDIDKEAVRVISALPAWVPGKRKGEPVRVSMMVPLIFKL
jgi:TonB family protein